MHRPRAASDDQHTPTRIVSLLDRNQADRGRPDRNPSDHDRSAGGGINIDRFEYLDRNGDHAITRREWDGGRAVYRLAPEPHQLNFVGSLHGGAVFSLADAALGVASNSWGRLCVALTVETPGGSTIAAVVTTTPAT